MGSGNQANVTDRSIAFTVKSGATAKVTVYGVASGGKEAAGSYTVIGLYDSEGKLVKASENIVAGKTPVTTFDITTAGTYYLHVLTTDNAGNVKTCDTATVAKTTVYRKRTCSSCKSCGWVSRYSCSRGTLINRNCVWTVTKSCRNCPNCTLDHWDSKAKVSYYTCSESAVANGGYYNYPNDCGTCGCGSWSGWSDYNLSSCAGSSSVQCESTTIYQ